MAKKKKKKSARVFAEKREITRRPAGANIVTDPSWGFQYTTQAGPCPSLRTSCPVQLFYKKGQPKLRFCRVQPRKKAKLKRESYVDKDGETKYRTEKPKYVKAKAPKQKGFTVSVDSAEDAQRIAAAACRCWKKSPEGFEQVVQSAEGKTSKVWRGSFEQCAIGKYEPGTAPLGRVRRKRRKKR